ncbi:MAG: ABC transporter permease [Chitinophagaceae bacterium]|nr:ABC transporter permease [Chitinophagaceae bacterium]
MIKNYISLAWRNLKKKPLFAAINCIGLAIGITSFVFIAIFVLDELSYDKYYNNSHRIYRLTYAAQDNLPWLKDVPAVAPGIASKAPEIERFTRLFQSGGLVTNDTVAFNEEKIFFADASFFNVFNLPFVSGNTNEFATDPNSIVISNRTAKKYFGNENPIGKELKIAGNDGLGDFNLKVTGVYKDLPHNAHFHFDFLIPYREQMASQSNIGVYTYLLLSPNISGKAVEEKLNRLKQQYFKEWKVDAKTIFGLQPVTSIHLQSDFFDEIEVNSNKKIIYIFSITAFLILLIACINYINISLAQSIKRSKEIGVRKVLGASKRQVILQFITESFVLLSIAIVISFLLIQAGLPMFNQLTKKSLSLQNNWYLIILLPVIISLGLLSALYPAVVLSNFNPILALKNIVPAGALKTITLRKGLLTFQFLIAVILLVCTGVIYNQLSFIRNRNLGFEKEKVIVIPLQSSHAQAQYSVLKQELLKNTNVLKVSASHSIPGDEMEGGIYRIPSSFVKEISNSTGFAENTLFVDTDYLGLMQIRMLVGKGFLNSEDNNSNFIINETAVKKYGWNNAEQAIGKTIEYFDPGDRTFHPALIIGVVSNFHYQSLRSQIEPLILRLSNLQESSHRNYLATLTTVSVKINGTNLQKTLEELKDAWKNSNMLYPFEYSFLDDRIKKLYSSDEKLGNIFGKFSFIALFITCIGLFGISILTLEHRTKEIGIRKVLGASVRNIVSIVSKDFLKLVFIASCIAFPIAGYFMHNWLEDFAYRTKLSWWIFAGAGLVALAIALITIGFQTIKTAISNPVKSLRTE